MSYLSQKIRKVIEDDREALCEMMTDEEVKEAIMNAPMPDLSSFDVENKTEKTEKNEKNEKTEKKKKEKYPVRTRRYHSNNAERVSSSDWTLTRWY